MSDASTRCCGSPHCGIGGRARAACPWSPCRLVAAPLLACSLAVATVSFAGCSSERAPPPPVAVEVETLPPEVALDPAAAAEVIRQERQQ